MTMKNCKIFVVDLLSVKNQIKPFIIVAVLHRRVQLVYWAHLRFIAPCRLQKNVSAVASRWQHCVQFELVPPAPETNALPLDQLTGVICFNSI